MLNILFPKRCCGCEKALASHERLLCVSCRHQIPLLCHDHLSELLIKKKFYGRLQLQHAISLMRFQKQGLTQKLLHHMKYYGVKELSAFFGNWLGNEMDALNNTWNVDMVIPVPLDRKRLKKRGYNQVAGFGKRMAAALDAEYRDNILLKTANIRSQVRKNRLLRFESGAVFTVNNVDELNDKHVLLVDDIITTGATIEKCAAELFKGKQVKLSVASIAITG